MFWDDVVRWMLFRRSKLLEQLHQTQDIPAMTIVALPTTCSNSGSKGSRGREMRKIACRSRHRLLSVREDSQDLKQRTLSVLRPGPNADTAINADEARWRVDDWPWLPNKHCGSWYLPPAEWGTNSAAATAINQCGVEVYFKSTDGHVGTYAMSLKRLNLSLIQILHKYGGCILVDSSVRKLLPDSFSRTIPIWCAVMNRIALKYRTELGLKSSSSPFCTNYDNDEWDVALHTPSAIVSLEEYLEISNLIDSRVELLYQSKAIVDIPRFVDFMKKPIRAMWIANGLAQNDTISSSRYPSCSGIDNYFIIICCNPSRYNSEGGKHHTYKIDSDPQNTFNQQSDYYYTPGAADDEDSWSRYLTPELFWMNHEKILDSTSTEDETDDMIDMVVHDSQQQLPKLGSINKYDMWLASDVDRIGEMNLWIGSRRAACPPECWESFDAILNVEYPTMQQSEEEGFFNQNVSSSRYYLQLPVEEGKRDKHQLEKWMPVGLVFIALHLQKNRRVLVNCAHGRDHSVAIVLAFVSLYCVPTHPLRLKPEFDSMQFGSVALFFEEFTTENQSSYLQSGIQEALIHYLTNKNGKELFLMWMHTAWQRKSSFIEPFADKESLRIALQLVKQDRENAEPTRCTMQKLNRFFMSNSLYRSINE